MAVQLKFKAEAFDGLTVQIANVPASKNLVEVFPLLHDNEEFSADLKGGNTDRNKIIRYVILMYDKNSPFITKYDDIIKRKKEVARFVGFTLSKKGVFKKAVVEIFKCENIEVNCMIIRYCRLQHSIRWTLLVAMNEDFYEDMNKMLSDKSKNQGAYKSTLDNLEVMESMKHHMLAQDNTKALSDEIWNLDDREKKTNLFLSPETRAQEKINRERTR